METIARLPLLAAMPNDPDGSLRGLGTGAIASPMAVSFREEKLALRTSSTMAVPPDATRSSMAMRDRS